MWFAVVRHALGHCGKLEVLSGQALILNEIRTSCDMSYLFRETQLFTLARLDPT